MARLVATGYTPLVLPTHDLVPQDRELNGDEHGRNHGSDDAAPAAGQEQHDEPILPPPVSGLSPYGVNGTAAATCPAPYSSEDPTLLTQERLLTGYVIVYALRPFMRARVIICASFSPGVYFFFLTTRDVVQLLTSKHRDHTALSLRH